VFRGDLTPCVSVGNIAMGGRGKTPVVIHLARLLVEAGERPAVLSRGYGRRLNEPGVVVVSDGNHVQADLDRSGDEPLLIARAVPGAAVLVCEQRAIARVLAERALGATVLLLDDGFQHRQVARDVDLVIIRARDLRGRALPFGRLREPVKALARADAVIVDDGADAGDPALSGRRTFAMRRSIGEAIPLESDRPWTPKRGPVVAVAGIAEPQRFAQALTAAGWTVARLMTFRDHHAYHSRDLAAIATAVRETGAIGAVTTEKDAVRLRWMRPLPVQMASIPLDVSIEPAAVFHAWLFDRLRAAREAHA